MTLLKDAPLLQWFAGLSQFCCCSIGTTWPFIKILFWHWVIWCYAHVWLVSYCAFLMSKHGWYDLIVLLATMFNFFIALSTAVRLFYYYYLCAYFNFVSYQVLFCHPISSSLDWISSPCVSCSLIFFSLSRHFWNMKGIKGTGVSFNPRLYPSLKQKLKKKR